MTQQRAMELWDKMRFLDGADPNRARHKAYAAIVAIMFNTHDAMPHGEVWLIRVFGTETLIMDKRFEVATATGRVVFNAATSHPSTWVDTMRQEMRTR